MPNLSPSAHNLITTGNEMLSTAGLLEQAYATALEAGRLSVSDAPRDLGSLAAAAIRINQANNPESVSRRGISFESIRNPEQRTAFEQAFLASEQLYGRVGIVTPQAAEFAHAGIDFAELARKYGDMEAAGYEPQIVLAAQGLEPRQWVSLFQNLQGDTAVNHDKRIRNGGLYISEDILTNWPDLSALPVGAQPVIDQAHCSWTLRIIPATDKPPMVSVDHSYQEDQHPTTGEYLTAQGIRLQANEAPFDASTYTWLKGTFNGGSQAPCGDWIPGDGQVRLAWGVVSDSRNDDMGARSAV